MTVMTTSAPHWGPLWGARAADWMAVEEQQVPTYVAALERLSPVPGQTVLEVGCGTGVFLQAAVEAGLDVHGLDASAELVELARRRVPDADVRQGEMEALPFGDASFDVVAGFNSFFFASDMLVALREARRVVRPGGTVLAQVWGRPERCDLDAMKHAIDHWLPKQDPLAPGPPPLYEDGVLAGLLAAAGLEETATFATTWSYRFDDDDQMLRALLSPGLVAIAIDRAGERAVAEAVLAAMAPQRRPDGSYELANEWVMATGRRR
jgi:SAM-dependent methyltransferase